MFEIVHKQRTLASILGAPVDRDACILRSCGNIDRAAGAHTARTRHTKGRLHENILERGCVGGVECLGKHLHLHTEKAKDAALLCGRLVGGEY